MKISFACLVLLSCLGTEIFAKNYYLQNTLSLSWYASFENCARQGLQLATVNTRNEQYLLEKTIKKAGMERVSFWLGGTDLSLEGRFVWMATGEPFVYTNWLLPYQPDNNENIEHCVHIWPDLTNTTVWNDAPCHHGKYFICEEQPKNCYNNEELSVVCEVLPKN